jgi:hypothetical protein
MCGDDVLPLHLQQMHLTVVHRAVSWIWEGCVQRWRERRACKKTAAACCGWGCLLCLLLLLSL